MRDGIKNGGIGPWPFLYVIKFRVQVPGGVLEDEQGALLPVLAAAGGQRHPEPHGLLRHVRHVQGISIVSALVIYNPATRFRVFFGRGGGVNAPLPFIPDPSIWAIKFFLPIHCQKG